MAADIRPFQVNIPQSDLDDLQARLSRTRWANELPADQRRQEQVGPVPPGWDYGVPVDFVRNAIAHWRDAYNWRRAEAALNAYPQFTTQIEGENVHFYHVRSARADALPLILTHGWPSSAFEYLGLIGPLTDPAAHGGDPADAFHVVVPSIPGFGFSGPTTQRGWSWSRVAGAWVQLMARLGYERYGAHGNDAGAGISPEMGRQAPANVVGVHVTQVFSFPSGDPTEFQGLTEEEMATLQFLQSFFDEMSGFAKLQETKPQNLAHAIGDSPAGQLAWSAQLLASLPTEELVTNAAIYWLTNTGASSARLYYETAKDRKNSEPTTVPLGLASFAYDMTPIRKFADRDHRNIVSWNKFDRGSHWSAFDAPDLLVDDIRQFFRQFR